jgi:hypothetical protein
VKNPVFKKQVDDLFEKVSWPHDPTQVAAQTPDKDLAGRITRGVGTAGAAKKLVTESIPKVYRAGKSVAGGVLAPASKAVAQPFYDAAKGVHAWSGQHPVATRNLIGLSLLAPILGGAFTDRQNANEDHLMNLREDPSRDVTASLDEFLEKKAGMFDTMKSQFAQVSAYTPKPEHAPPGHGFGSAPMMGLNMQNSMASGIGSGIGQGLVGLAGNALAGGAGAIRDFFLTDRRRRALFTQLIQTDPVLTDAIERSPVSMEMLKEAYGTMCRFAPSLALDINAVRSFLREAVIGGAGVNYATIKNLVETEKATHFNVK